MKVSLTFKLLLLINTVKQRKKTIQSRTNICTLAFEELDIFHFIVIRKNFLDQYYLFIRQNRYLSSKAHVEQIYLYLHCFVIVFFLLQELRVDSEMFVIEFYPFFHSLVLDLTKISNEKSCDAQQVYFSLPINIFFPSFEVQFSSFQLVSFAVQ